MLSIGELAKRSGVTVRALRYYESKKLICPQRTEAGQRVYKYPDIVRLQQIQLLKRAGFTLNQILQMIGSAEIEAKQILHIQRDLLSAQLKQTKAAIAALDATIERLDDTATDLFTLCNMIKVGELSMDGQEWQKVWDEFYSKEEQEAWRKAKEAIPEDVRKNHENAWPRLIAKAESLVGSDPASPEAQELLKEWQGLLSIFENMDPSLMKSANRMYEKIDEWPEGSPQSPFSSEVWDFINAAKEAAV